MTAVERPAHTARLSAEAHPHETEERPAFLLNLSDALSCLTGASEIMEAAARLLGDHLRADRTIYGEIEGEFGSRIEIIRAQHIRRGTPLPGRMDYDAKSNAWMNEQLRSGAPFVVADASDDPRLSQNARAAMLAANTYSLAVVSLLETGREVVISCEHGEPRSWSASEIDLIREVAERTRAAAERTRAESALRESEAKYRAIFQSINEGCSLLDIQFDEQRRAVDFIVRDANRATQDHIGPVRGLIGKRVRDILPNIEQKWIDRYGRVARSGDSMHFEDWSATSQRWFSVHASRVGGDGSTLVAIVYEDITERKRAEAAAELASRTRARDNSRRELAAAEEAERRRLARELHDQLGQQLTGLALGLEDARRLVTSRDSTEREIDGPLLRRLEQLKSLASELTVAARYLALELRPPELDDMGFENALETYTAEWSARFGIRAEVLVTGDAGRQLPPDIGSALYRIAQEALTNAAKHAHPKSISLIVEKKDLEVQLIVEDDGCGFDLDATMRRAQRERRLGLIGIEERAALLGGAAHIESSPGHGTSVFARLPVPVEIDGA